MTIRLHKLRPFKVALAQTRVEGGERQTNLRRAARMIAAAEADAQVVLLPEALDLGWTSPSGRRFAEPVPEGGRVKAESRGRRFIFGTPAMRPERMISQKKNP